jgi:type IV pilus assembly protein PilE
VRRIHLQSRGVTLPELLTVIVIIGILAAVAVPTYRNYLIRAQRSDATTALLRLASAQEKHMLQYGVYVTDTASVPNSPETGGLGIPTTSEHGFYSLAVEATATGYNATATPIAGGGQHVDTDCVTLTVNESGTKSATDLGGANSTGKCFR